MNDGFSGRGGGRGDSFDGGTKMIAASEVLQRSARGEQKLLVRRQRPSLVSKRSWSIHYTGKMT